MATVKERKLIREITDLALDVNLQGGEYTITADYMGHIHAFDIRILNSKLIQQNENCEWAYLSGKSKLWDEAQSLARLETMLAQVKKHHKSFDADGVKL